jgi:phosphohistidine phosphatase
VVLVTDVRRRLVVMRHAKAEPYGTTDHERGLTARGRGSAVEAGLLPEVALVSSATRTRETWAAVVEGSGADAAAASFSDRLFTGGPDEVLEAVQAVAEGVGTVLYIGHNPTATFLAHLLDDGDGDATASSGMLRGLAPGALVALEVRVPWSELGPESGRVVDFYVGGA